MYAHSTLILSVFFLLGRYASCENDIVLPQPWAPRIGNNYTVTWTNLTGTRVSVALMAYYSKGAVSSLEPVDSVARTIPNSGSTQWHVTDPSTWNVSSSTITGQYKLEVSIVNSDGDWLGDDTDSPAFSLLPAAATPSPSAGGTGGSGGASSANASGASNPSASVTPIPGGLATGAIAGIVVAAVVVLVAALVAGFCIFRRRKRGSGKKADGIAIVPRLQQQQQIQGMQQMQHDPWPAPQSPPSQPQQQQQSQPQQAPGSQSRPQSQAQNQHQLTVSSSQAIPSLPSQQQYKQQQPTPPPQQHLYQQQPTPPPQQYQAPPPPPQQYQELPASPLPQHQYQQQRSTPPPPQYQYPHQSTPPPQQQYQQRFTPPPPIPQSHAYGHSHPPLPPLPSQPQHRQHQELNPHNLNRHLVGEEEDWAGIRRDVPQRQTAYESAVQDRYSRAGTGSGSRLSQMPELRPEDAIGEPMYHEARSVVYSEAPMTAIHPASEAIWRPGV